MKKTTTMPNQFNDILLSVETSNKFIKNSKQRFLLKKRKTKKETKERKLKEKHTNTQTDNE